MLLLMVVSCAQKAQDDTVSVIPEPMFMRVDEGVFNVNKDTKLLVDYTSEEMLRIAGFLNEKLSKAAGFELELITDGQMPKENVIAFMNALAAIYICGLLPQNGTKKNKQTTKIIKSK